MTQKKSASFSLPSAAPKVAPIEVLRSIVGRVHAHAMTMIYLANDRDDVQKGDPKVGGHPSASSSALHLLSTLHLWVKNPQDYIACKPHASPTDHANNYLLRLFAETDNTRMPDERMKLAMKNLRHYSSIGEPVFQSYHSSFDPDHWNYLPSGSVGIPPVNALYLAHAYRMAETQGFKVPKDAHFWCIMGDSEYREGSLMEALPEGAERGLGNVTWIVDYNRQSLDGHRILNEAGLGGKDNDRIEGTALANGWEVMQLRHGKLRQKIFADSPDGEALQNVIERALPDYEFQSLLASKNAKTIVDAVSKYDRAAGKALKALDESDVVNFLSDLGGHDMEILADAYQASKKDPDKPMLIIAHTVKGWGLKCAAQSANHSAMLDESEVREIRARNGMKGEDLFAFERFDEKSFEGQYLKARGDWNWNGINALKNLRKENLGTVQNLLTATGADKGLPTEVGINLKFVPIIHTQWMLGQIAAKLSRIADTSIVDTEVRAPQKPLTPNEKAFKATANLWVTMAPDVGTSTNLNANMDGKIYGTDTEDYERDYGVKDTKSPDIVPHESMRSRHIRFDIAEGNVMSCVGSYGKIGELLGVPFVPVMTVYDFFLKRALDQLFYDAYWKSSFICVGTPAGVTLAPEGAQHSWKSDIQIANMITWEPAFAVELDWIVTESVRRHFATYFEGEESPNSNLDRSAVVIRGVTRGLEQKEMLVRLRAHKRFEGQKDEEILETTRRDCLEGAYYLVDHRGAEGYRPSENVLNIFSLGSLVTEALAASDELLKEGVFANVIQVTCTDLLLGNLGYKNNYRHLREGLGITGDLYLSPRKTSPAEKAYPPAFYGSKPFEKIGSGSAGQAQLMSLGGRRIPMVSVHDGEAGLMDNIGAIVGTLQKALAVRKHSKSGRPSDVYHYHGIDAEAVVKAAKDVLNESGWTSVQIEGEGAGPVAAYTPTAALTSEADATKKKFLN